jgi:hypothetical protein
MHGDAEPCREPGAGTARQFEPEPGEHVRQRDAPPAVPAGQPACLHRERDLRAGRAHAQEPESPQEDQDRAASGRAVGHGPRIPAVHARGHRPAGRAGLRRRRARRRDHHRVPGVLDPAHPQPCELREQQGQQFRPVLRNLQAADGGRRRWKDRRHGRLGRQRGSRESRCLGGFLRLTGASLPGHADTPAHP